MSIKENMSKKIMALLSRSKNKWEALNKCVLDTVETQGWQIIEDHLKTGIERQYKALLTCKPEELKENQLKIDIAIDIITSVYNMAGLEWKYDSVQKPERLFDDNEEELSVSEKSTQEYLKYLDKKNNIGRVNG